MTTLTKPQQTTSTGHREKSPQPRRARATASNSSKPAASSMPGYDFVGIAG